MTRIVMTAAGLASLLVFSASPAIAQLTTPHWILAPPQPIPSSGAAVTHSGHAVTHSGVSVPAHGVSGHLPVQSEAHFDTASLHHLPPGVANDPGAVGPGHIGAGEHWLRAKPPTRAPIPGAVAVPVWKSPYSYGYFGAQDKRHWSRQHGYRDKVLQWTLR